MLYLSKHTYDHMQFLVNDSEWGLKLLQATDTFKNTPLHEASRRGALSAIQ